MGCLHRALKLSGYEGHDLEVCLPRLLYCLKAEDSGIFQGDSFAAWIRKSKIDGSDLLQKNTRASV
ncbi:MAG: hypothetical protein LBP22_15440 [Deltaproteobacteria bacterium]|nr:hypothetical protein [Deltaproteobacteria bacterium]